MGMLICWFQYPAARLIVAFIICTCYFFFVQELRPFSSPLDNMLASLAAFALTNSFFFAMLVKVVTDVSPYITRPEGLYGVIGITSSCGWQLELVSRALSSNAQRLPVSATGLKWHSQWSSAPLATCCW
jgi:hypothetical protein